MMHCVKGERPQRGATTSKVSQNADKVTCDA